jgi:uncharacterized membrane protein HdeD (DUF308 family)
MIPTIETFLLGVIATTSLIAGVFFLKFWRHTRDVLFLAFAVAFLVEGVNRIALLFATHSNEGSPWIYVVRLVAFLLILAAILKKNYGGVR